MKRWKKTVVLMALVTMGMNCYSIQADDVDTQTESVFSAEQIHEWEQAALEEADSSIPKGDFKSRERAAVGGWSWRDGVICVTDSYARTPLFNNGHAGIVAPVPYYDSTIEANEGAGVEVVGGEWIYRFPEYTVYQYGVKRTSVEQDQRASEWAARQIGKSYNHDFFNIHRRDKFYCSQLVWAAYKDVTGVDIGTWEWGAAIHPFELMHSGETELIYRNK